MEELPYAENVNYWQTSQTSPDSWIDKTKKLIEEFGGKILMEAFGNEPTSGHAAFMLLFEIEGDTFKVVWPVLKSQSGKEKAARIQAATLLYHDVKAKCLTAKVLGARTAFFQYWQLRDGRTASNLAAPELLRTIPSLFLPAPSEHRNIIEGEAVTLSGDVEQDT
jgi:hypothetical protein